MAEKTQSDHTPQFEGASAKRVHCTADEQIFWLIIFVFNFISLYLRINMYVYENMVIKVSKLSKH